MDLKVIFEAIKLQNIANSARRKKMDVPRQYYQVPLSILPDPQWVQSAATQQHKRFLQITDRG